jgi:hypothetical protein
MTGQLAQAFSTFERSAFRLETLPAYDVPEEEARLRLFRSGAALPPRSPDTDEWLAFIARSVGAGRSVERVHVVTHPLSDYLRFELACYLENEAAGERVGIAVRDEASPLPELVEDFWLFDDEHVFVMQYDANGRFLGAEPAADPARYRTLRERAQAAAVPLSRYRAGGVGGTERWTMAPPA